MTIPRPQASRSERVCERLKLAAIAGFRRDAVLEALRQLGLLNICPNLSQVVVAGKLALRGNQRPAHPHLMGVEALEDPRPAFIELAQHHSRPCPVKCQKSHVKLLSSDAVNAV